MKTELENFVEKIKGVRSIVINNCYGGFGLSDKALTEYKSLAGIDDSEFDDSNIPRDDPYLVKVVNDLGMGANGSYSNLKVIEIPADVEWTIQEYDGVEWVAEKHRTWS
jgi:hypothetical protein